MTSESSITCTMCGGAVDATLLGGICPLCLMGDAMNGPEDEAAEPCDGHELLGEIARGGMGVVYRARQFEPERMVALKTLRSASLDSPEAKARFKNEAEVMVALDHPAILPVYHCGEMDGIPFFTMKLVEGGSLADAINRYSGNWRGIAELMARVCDGVQHAHERGVLHRDLKPGNILFDSTGAAYVSDFGIAKLANSQNAGLTLTMSMIGTPHYLAPEIAAGSARAASVSSDVWSLGVIVYELLTGQKPFKGESMTQVVRALELEDATTPRKLRPAVPRDLEVIALKALTREPSRRYSSAQALAEDLRAWLEGRPITARAVPMHERAWLWSRRNPWLAGTAALLVLAVLAAAGSLLWGFVRVNQENRRVIASETETRAQLRAALLHQAHSGRVSREMGWRSSGIEALRRADEIQPGADVRDELVAHLAGYDLVSGVREFEDIVLPSSSLQYCIRTNNDTASMSVALLDDLKNLFNLPDKYGGRLTTPLFGPEDRWVVVGTEFGTRAFSMAGGNEQLAHWPEMPLIGASADRSLIHLGKEARWQLIDTATWQPVAGGTLDGLKAPSTVLVRQTPAFHPDPKVTLGAVPDGADVRVVNWRTNEEVQRLTPVQPPQVCHWSGSSLIVGCGDVGHVYDYLRGRDVFLGPGFSEPHYILTTRGGTELLASSDTRQSGLWHLHSGKRLVSGRGFVATNLAADEVHFMGRMPKSQIGRIERPTVMQFLPDALLKNSLTAAFRSFAISPDGRLLALHDRTQLVVHAVDSGNLIARQEAPETIALGFSSDGKALLALNPKGLEVWTLGRQEKRLTLEKTRDVPAPAGRIFMNGRMLQDGERFLASTQKLKPFHETWRLYRDKLKWERQPAPECPTAGITDVTPDGVFNIGGQNQYNVVNNIEQKRFILLEQDNLKKALGAFSPDGRHLVMVDVSYEWKLYGQDAWARPEKVVDPGHKTVKDGGTVTGSQIPAWARSGRWFAVSPDGKRVSLVDLATQQELLTLESPIDLMIDVMLVSEDERTLVLQRRGGSVEIWHLDRLAREMRALGVEVALPDPPPPKATPTDLAGEFEEIELLSWGPKWSAQ
jgi:hypothetical protein